MSPERTRKGNRADPVIYGGVEYPAHFVFYQLDHEPVDGEKIGYAVSPTYPLGPGQPCAGDTELIWDGGGVAQINERKRT